jgi:hypothetical protein
MPQIIIVAGQLGAMAGQIDAVIYTMFEAQTPIRKIKKMLHVGRTESTPSSLTPRPDY